MTAILLGQPAGWLGSITSPGAYLIGFWSVLGSGFRVQGSGFRVLGFWGPRFGSASLTLPVPLPLASLGHCLEFGNV